MRRAPSKLSAWRTKGTELGSVQWCSLPGQEAMGKITSTGGSPKHQEACLHCSGDQTLAQAAQRGKSDHQHL